MLKNEKANKIVFICGKSITNYRLCTTYDLKKGKDCIGRNIVQNNKNEDNNLKMFIELLKRHFIQRLWGKAEEYISQKHVLKTTKMKISLKNVVK